MRKAAEIWQKLYVFAGDGSNKFLKLIYYDNTNN